MRILTYLAFGALIHWIFWGTAWFGVASFALLVLWPFFIIFWFWVVIAFAVVVIAVIVFIVLCWEHYITEPRRHRARLNRIREQTIRYDHLNR